MHKSIAAGAALVAIFAASTATAGVLPQKVQQELTRVEVSLKGLNLRNSAQVEEAYSRLRLGAIEACASNSEFNRREQRRDRACAIQALNTVVASMNRASLTARHERSANMVIASR